ncbi:hypothetical protein GG851_01515 [Bordetella petrii]|nr:hypothetical protein [Bordetella petrii]
MKSIVAGALLASCVLSTTAQAAEATVAFQMPLNIENWKPDILGRNGMYRFRQVRGACQITFAQNLGADAAKAAGRTPRDTLEVYVRQLGTRMRDVTRSKAPDLELRANTGDPIALLSEEVAYRGNDGVDYRNRLSAQWVGSVELLIIAGCPATEWGRQQAAINAFIGKVSVHR